MIETTKKQGHSDHKIVNPRSSQRFCLLASSFTNELNLKAKGSHFEASVIARVVQSPQLTVADAQSQMAKTTE